MKITKIFEEVVTSRYEIFLPDGTKLICSREAAEWFDDLWQDASRYRWFKRRGGGCPFAETDPAWDADKLDAAIDAERNAV